MSRRPRALLALFTGLVAAAALAVGLVTGQSAPAQALTGSQFDAGNIISDAVFYDARTMSAADVQAFLNQKYTGCAPGYVCLRDYTTKTTSRPAESGLCSAYTGKASETAAAVIANVATACGVNPQALLVLLQKESGLVTSTTPSYQTATGFGCPDSTGCNSKYYGFFNQVYLAARQFRLYRLNPTDYNYVAGRSSYILYNPNTKCGGSNVVIQNQATAGLYDYTPYQPNAAALANLTGTGDKCSAYGNRNFWYYFNTWFGSAPTPHDPGGLLLTRSDGSLWYYANSGNLTEPYQYPPVEVGTRGWKQFTHILTGDVDGDGLSDVVATRPDGSLWLYRNDGSTLPYPSSIRIGASGWDHFGQIALGDVNGDGRADIVATRPNGTVWLYPNTGDASRPFGPRVQIAASGWRNPPQLMLGDIDGDGLADIVATHSDGSLWLYHATGNASAPFAAGVRIGAGGWQHFDKITLTDTNSDGLADLVATQPNGTLWLYLNTPGQAQPFHHGTRIGANGWQAFNTLAATDVPVPHPTPTTDLIATRPDGSLWQYPVQQQNPFPSRASIGSGWQNFQRLLLGDVDGDGRADIIGVKPDGQLWLYRNTGTPGHPYSGQDRTEIGKSGWQKLILLAAADVNGDGRVDIVATRADGTLWLYPNSGNANNPFPTRRLIGHSGWKQFDRIVAADVNGDGKSDLIATRPDGSLVRYLSNGSLTHPYSGRQSTALSGWQDYTGLTAADIDGDGRADLVATRADGTLWLDRDAGRDRFPHLTRLSASGWSGYDTVLAGDVAGDGRADLVSRAADGTLYLYRNAGAVQPYTSAAQLASSGWQGVTMLSEADVNHDGLPDLVGVQSPGSLWLYRNTGSTSQPFTTTQQSKIGRSGWQSYDTLVSADVNGDGYADIVGRKPDGSLWLYRNTGNPARPFTSAKSQIGWNWQVYDTILAADVNHDGLPDLIAREPDGTLWVYLNSHDPNAPYPTRMQIGTGWQVYDKIAAVDVDSDGRADLVASKPDGSLWLYRNSGNRTAPYPAAIQIAATGFASYDRMF